MEHRYDGYVRLYINDALYFTFTGKTADAAVNH